MMTAGARVDSNNIGAILPSLPARRARGIIDISRTALADVPTVLEERLRKSKGVFSVQANVVSGKLTIEFDPALITLETIRKRITAH